MFRDFEGTSAWSRYDGKHALDAAPSDWRVSHTSHQPGAREHFDFKKAMTRGLGTADPVLARKKALLVFGVEDQLSRVGLTMEAT